MLQHEQEANEKEQLKRKGQIVVYGDYIQVTMESVSKCITLTPSRVITV